MKRVFASILLFSGLVLGVHAAWIPAKARVAQFLLERSWDNAREGIAPRPWPGADLHPLARLSIGAESWIVLDGSSGRTLAFGPGHLPSSAPPGSPGICVIAGHRDTAFGKLAELRVGERAELTDARGQQSTYVVRRISRAGSPRWSTTSPGDWLVLVTCVAGSREARLVVEAQKETVRGLLPSGTGGHMPDLEKDPNQPDPDATRPNDRAENDHETDARHEHKSEESWSTPRWGPLLDEHDTGTKKPG